MNDDPSVSYIDLWPFTALPRIAYSPLDLSISIENSIPNPAVRAKMPHVPLGTARRKAIKSKTMREVGSRARGMAASQNRVVEDHWAGSTVGQPRSDRSDSWNRHYRLALLALVSLGRGR